MVEAIKEPRRSGLRKLQSMLQEVFGLGRAAALSAVVLLLAILALGIFLFVYLKPPSTITIISGPEGSTYRRAAERYAQILQRNGIKLKILPSEGSGVNIKKLADPRSKVDVGFVQSGMNIGILTDKLVSLGSISYQPLFVFYSSTSQIDLLSQLSGQRVAVGAAGSGSRGLALMLLAANGISPGGPTRIQEMDSTQAAGAILKGNVDAVFLMGDSVSTALIRQLLNTPFVRLFSFVQADAYTRRVPYLNKLILARGSIDLGKDIPARDVSLLAPTVELIARKGLHPALSDLLIEAAQEVHSPAGFLRRKGEFPAPIEQEFPISSEAKNFYKSGKSFLYRSLPFQYASLVNRIVVVFVPMIILLLPVLRLVPAVYRWRFRSRIFRWYRRLLMIEQELVTQMAPGKREALMQRLNNIEEAVNRMKVPASFADQFYGLRGHIALVRNRLRP